MPHPTVSYRRAVAVLALASAPLLCASLFAHGGKASATRGAAAKITAANATVNSAANPSANSADGIVDTAAVAAKPFEITVTDATGSTVVGRPTTYHIAIRNLSGTDFPQAHVTETMTAGTRYVRATPAGSVAGDSVTWTLDIAARATRTIDVTTIPGGRKEATERQLIKVVQRGSNDALDRDGRPRTSTTVCVQARDGGPTLACGSDVDLLAATSESTGGSALEIGLFVVVGGGLAAGAAVYLRRRPTLHDDPPPPDRPNRTP
jgi:hypothetical protein